MNEQTQDLHPVVATPMRLIEMAVSQNFDGEKLSKVMDLYERWERNEARKAFDRAFAQFKAEGVKITKTVKIATGPLAGKMHADLADVIDVTTPSLSKFGLSSFWKTTRDEPDWIEVTCFLRHDMGHTETAAMGGPPDIGPGRNAIQARGSSKSYLKRYTYLDVTGLAAGDEDNDGATNGELAETIKKIEEIGSIEELQKFFLTTVQPYKEAKNSAACNALIEAKDKRKAQLQPKPASQQSQAATVATSKAIDDGKMEIDCTILDCRHKQEQKTGGKVTSAGYVRLEFNAPSGTSAITCWHQHLWPALSTAKMGDRGVFIVKEAKGYLNLEDVTIIGSQKFIDGKPVVEGA